MLTTELKEIVNKISKNKNVQAVYLFGSYARGEESPNSDVDLCIIGDLSKEEKTKIFFLGNEKTDISFFSGLPIIIQIKIFSEGKLLFVKNEDEIQKIAWQTLHNYREILPLIERRVNEMFHYA